MRRLALVIALSAVACGGSPTSPSGQTEQFTWTVNGQTFTASSNGRSALRPSGTTNISLTGANCSIGAFISVLAKNPAVGTFPVSEAGISLRWIPDARTSTNQDAFDSPGSSGFNVGTGSGTVTITSLTSDWISGTFNVVAVPFFTNQDKTQKTITGSFDLQFRDRVIC
jgi:hypothetical protein